MRLIARLDIKGANLIKGKQFEGYRVIGKPWDFSSRYAVEGIDELLFVDNVASLYGSDFMVETLRKVTESIFVPITVAGGVKSVADAHSYLRAGADKIAVNTAALQRPELLTEIASEIGSQSLIASIEVKASPGTQSMSWECMGNFGREHSGIHLEEWLGIIAEKGVGEVLVTSIDDDGMKLGFSSDLAKVVQQNCQNPVIYSGGISSVDHIEQLNIRKGVDAVAIGTAFHEDQSFISRLKGLLQ